jgi:hypothetical protein
MFGRLTFLIGGHMACGIVVEDVALRLGEAGADTALGQPHVRPMDFTGRPMHTWSTSSPAQPRTTKPSANDWSRRRIRPTAATTALTRQRRLPANGAGRGVGRRVD